MTRPAAAAACSSRVTSTRSSTAARGLRLYGQEDNGAVWAICRMNMLLHGIPDADIRNGDTLADPKHIEDGALMRFDRVIANPPFSQNYSKRGIQFTDRFRFGWCPTTGQESRPDVRAAHAGDAEADRQDGGGHAARRAVPWRRGKENPPGLAQRGLHRGGHRPAARTSSTAPASRPAFW